MDPKLQELIDSAKSDYDAKRKKEKVRQDAILVHEHAQDEIEKGLAFELLPDVVRQYAQLEGNFLSVVIPGLAVISRPVYIHRPYMGGNDMTQVMSVDWSTTSGQREFTLSQWKSSEGEIYLHSINFSTGEFGEALAMAAEIGDGKEEAEAEAEKERESFKSPPAEEEAIAEPTICPLQSLDGRGRWCDRNKCEWWHDGFGRCSVYALGEYAAQKTA